MGGSLRVLGPAPSVDEGSVVARVADRVLERAVGEVWPEDVAPPPRPGARDERVEVGEGIEEDAPLFDRRLLSTCSGD
jgi:hypothetical protein